MFAIWAAECVVVPINYKLHPREMEQILDDAGVAQVFASPKIAAELAPLTAVPIEVIGTDAYASRFGARRRRRRRHRPGDAGVAVLHQRNHRPVEGRDAVAPQPDGDDGRPIWRTSMRPTRTAAWSTAHRCRTAPASTSPPYVLRGARQVVPASGAFEPDEFLDLCDHHPGCSAFLAPTMVQRLVQTGRPRPRNLRTVVYGGGPMYVDSLKKAMAAFGPIFVQLYGQGEAPMTITGLRRADHLDADDAVLGSVGLRALRRGRRGARRGRLAGCDRRDR